MQCLKDNKRVVSEKNTGFCNLCPVLLTKHYLGEQINTNETDGTCDMYGRQEKSIQGFGRETLKKEIAWKTCP
jgi:hypothetical protein